MLEDGGDEDQAIASMLHDSVEDGGGRPVLDPIARLFGSRVAAIAQGCSDSVEGDPREAWIERKRRHLAHLPATGDDATLRVALADKIHNARSIVHDYREEGQARYGSGSPRRLLASDRAKNRAASLEAARMSAHGEERYRRRALPRQPGLTAIGGQSIDD